MLRLTRDVADAMLAHAVRGVPWEACGLFAGAYASDFATRFVPMSNAAASSQIYQLDPQEMLDVERTLDDEGLAVLGVMHSHTHTSAYPSPTDVADAARFDPLGTQIFVIVSLRRSEPVLRAYRMANESIREETVEIVPNPG